ncbi:MAG: NUDIX domain-containing protein [bacterium]|nr:NUDIX domain-containing protein [bacterium]
MDISLMIEDIKLNFRVGALLKYKDKVLIEKNETVTFSVIPGGRVKIFEDTKQALDRELKEELGIDISKEKSNLVSIVENFFIFNNIKYHEMYFIYEYNLSIDYNIKDGMSSLDSDDSKYYWKSKEELENIEMLPNELKDVILLKEFKKYVVRNC